MPTSPTRPNTPTPTLSAEELIAKTNEFSKKYLQGLLDILSSQTTINKAVASRQILIADPEKRNVNTATLEDIHDQFDEAGNKLAGATYTFHDPVRTGRESKQFLGDKDVTDREEVAMLSVYFEAGADIILQNMLQDPTQEYVSKLIDAIRITVGFLIRDSIGFVEPKGYTPKPEMLAKIQLLLDNPFDLVNKAIVNYTYFPDLQRASDVASNLHDRHFGGKLEALNQQKNPSQSAIAEIVAKQELLQRTSKAIENFSIDFNTEKLLGTLIDVKRDDDARDGRKKKTTKVINAAATTAQKYLSALNNTTLVGHPSVMGMFGNSGSASTSASPSLNASNGTQENKSPPRSPKP